MMKLSFLLFTLCVPSLEAATRVAVLELGKGGTVRRTTSNDVETSVEGVASFWNALHQQQGRRRKLQHAGMTVVPDLFNKPDAGIVIGISGNGVDLETMPNGWKGKILTNSFLMATSLESNQVRSPLTLKVPNK